MQSVRIGAIVLVSIFAILQFIRPDRSAGTVGGPEAIAATFPVPADVDRVLAKACNDCHSNATRYPWYSEIQPVGWWIQDHIDDARSHLNLDEFGSLNLARQYHKLQEIESEVRDEMMPLDSYLPMHPDARLSTDERRLLTTWALSLRDSMRSWYPEDSLQRRRSRPETITDSTETNS